jgi:hypothetical protein
MAVKFSQVLAASRPSPRPSQCGFRSARDRPPPSRRGDLRARQIAAKRADVVMQRALIARASIVANLDLYWAMARWQLSAPMVTIVPFKESIASSFGTAVTSSDFASVAIWPSTIRSQPQALTTGQPFFRLRNSQEGFFHLGKFRHVRCILTAAQLRAQGDHQQVVQRAPSGVPGRGSSRPHSRHQTPPRHSLQVGDTSYRLGSSESEPCKRISAVKLIRSARPLRITTPVCCLRLDGAVPLWMPLVALD